VDWASRDNLSHGLCALRYQNDGMKSMTPLSLVVLLSACSGAPMTAAGEPGEFPAQPLLSLSSMSGALRVDVRTSPQPPMRGSQSAQLTITDSSGARVNGLSLNVLPWMPVMGHGTSVVPTTVETSPGVYTIDNVYFSMPGLWALRTTISPPMGQPTGATASSDYVEPQFDIP